jgi:bis(5'-nucleosidyl)-tetraphosphatase
MHPMESESLQPSVFSSGYLVFRRVASLQFLLMRHDDRWDLPKGHLDEGETKSQAAIRELREETGITPDLLWTDRGFVFEHRYWVPSRKDPSRRVLKELTIYLGLLLEDREIECTEHRGFQWWDWCPPHRIQVQTIDPLLESVELHLQQSADTRLMLSLSK